MLWREPNPGVLPAVRAPLQRAEQDKATECQSADLLNGVAHGCDHDAHAHEADRGTATTSGMSAGSGP